MLHQLQEPLWVLFIKLCPNGWGLQTNIWFISAIIPLDLCSSCAACAKSNFKSFPAFLYALKIACRGWTTHKCKYLAEHQLFLWWRLSKVGVIKARQECKKSEHALRVFCLIVCSFASVHPGAAAQGKYRFCLYFQREGGKKKCSPGRWVGAILHDSALPLSGAFSSLW